jgi:riboflavin synthase
MYTGITRGLFPVVDVIVRAGAARLTVELSDALAEGVELGASISVDGVCLTASAIAGRRISFDAIDETRRLTTLGELRVGHHVSIERSARLGDELGGHDVYGHVIGTGSVLAREELGAQLDLTIGVPPEWMKYILHKGFIALDGSSLTVDDVRAAGSFKVHLIPETVRLTSFGHKQVGDRINVELDAKTVAIVDTVERVIAERYAPSTTTPA